MKKHLTKPHYWFAPLFIIIDIVFFGFTDPSKVSSMLLIIGFLLMAATLFAVLRLFARFLTLYGVPRQFANRFMGILSGAGALCLALSSVGELSVRDIVVILPLAVLLYVYLFYTKAKHA